MRKVNSKKQKMFFTTRPTLASYLLECGANGKRAVNPYDLARPAWTFERDKRLEQLLSDYFRKEVTK